MGRGIATSFKSQICGQLYLGIFWLKVVLWPGRVFHPLFHQNYDEKSRKYWLCVEKVMSEQYVMRLVFTWTVVKDLSYFQVVSDWQYWLISLIYRAPASLISWRLSTALLYSWPHKNVLSKNSTQMNHACQSDSALKRRAFTQQS